MLRKTQGVGEERGKDRGPESCLQCDVSSSLSPLNANILINRPKTRPKTESGTGSGLTDCISRCRLNGLLKQPSRHSSLSMKRLGSRQQSTAVLAVSPFLSCFDGSTSQAQSVADLSHVSLIQTDFRYFPRLKIMESGQR